MSFADSLLSTGERITHREKQHWFVFVWGARFTILAIVVAAILFWISSSMDATGISGSARTCSAGSSSPSSSAAWSSSSGRSCTTSTRST